MSSYPGPAPYPGTNQPPSFGQLGWPTASTAASAPPATPAALPPQRGRRSRPSSYQSHRSQPSGEYSPSYGPHTPQQFPQYQDPRQQQMTQAQQVAAQAQYVPGPCPHASPQCHAPYIQPPIWANAPPNAAAYTQPQQDYPFGEPRGPMMEPAGEHLRRISAAGYASARSSSSFGSHYSSGRSERGGYESVHDTEGEDEESRRRRHEDRRRRRRRKEKEREKRRSESERRPTIGGTVMTVVSGMKDALGPGKH